ncbi:MAG: ABC transporter permease [Desulfurococcales archaeon]|nr:ABC transporter permease [Desulfurococcales archaeon]
MVYRQVKRFFRARSRVLGTLLNPIIWVLFFGLGWSNVFNFPMAKAIFGGVDYLTFLAPGVIGMTVFTASFISGVSVIWDKQFGFLKEVLVAPVSRAEAMVGRLVGDSLTTLLQVAIIAGLMYVIAGSLNPWGAAPTLLLAFLASLAFSSLGVVLALKMRSMEGFQLIINLLMLPLLFLSGAFYPLNTMPEWMKALSYVNPLTYAVDGMRYFLAGTSAINPLLDTAVLSALSAALLTAAAALFRGATID